MSKYSSAEEEYKELSEQKREYLKCLEIIELRLTQLDKQIRDELDDKLIVTSDKEFDDASADPRYEYSDYKSKSEPKIKGNEKMTISNTNRSQIKGLYKGDNINTLPIPSNNEMIQKEKIEKSLQNERERKKILRSNLDTNKAISSLNKSLSTSRELYNQMKQREKEDRDKHSNEEFKSYFELSDDIVNYSEHVVSNKIEMGDTYLYEKDPAFDIYSRKYIRTRFLPFNELKEHMKNTKILRISKLFAEVPPSTLKLPYVNFIIVGVIASKSDPLITSDGRSKYMRIKLTDFHVDLILLLFGEAFNKYWNLQIGSIIAILNPEIIPSVNKFGNNQRNSVSKSFTLRVNLDSNCILEYARFRDFGFCMDLSHNNKCNNAVDLSKSRYCDYHQQKRSDKTASKRNEMGTNYKLFTPVDQNGNKQVMVITQNQLTDLESVQNFNENSKKSNSGLAIENAASNPSFVQKKTTEMIVTDYSNPTTMANLKTEEERQRKNFSSANASQAFKYSNRVNKDAIRKQEFARQLDKKLRKKQAKDDPQLRKELEKVKLNAIYQKERQNRVVDLKMTLKEASKNDKTLKIDKNLLIAKQKQWKENEEILKQHNLKRQGLPDTSNLLKRPKGEINEKNVYFSSDSNDSNSDSD